METFVVTVAPIHKSKLRVFTMMVDCRKRRAIFVVVSPDKITVFNKVRQYIARKDAYNDRFTLDAPSGVLVTENKDLLVKIENSKVVSAFVM